MRRLSFEVDVEEEEEEERELWKSRVLSGPRRSFHRTPSSLSSALSFVSSRKSFSYDKLAQVPIQLTVVKLDGSSFEVDVRKTATVAELKQAVESVFSHLPTKGPGKISWRHVWSHFCLSYRGHKLLIDSDNIKHYGIKDGAELRFVRHVSIAYNLIKKRSRKRLDAPRPSTIPEDQEEEGQQEEEEEDYGDLENLRCQQNKKEVEENSTHPESMLSHIFRGWFLYSRLSSSSVDRLRFEGDGAGPARWAGGFVGCFRSLFHFCDKRPPSYSSRVSQVEI